MARPKMIYLGCIVLLLAMVEATPPGIANHPSQASCKIKKYKMCYNLVHVCPKFCPNGCDVECASCKPICLDSPPAVDPVPPTYSPPAVDPVPPTYSPPAVDPVPPTYSPPAVDPVPVPPRYSPPTVDPVPPSPPTYSPTPVHDDPAPPPPPTYSPPAVDPVPPSPPTYSPPAVPSSPPPPTPSPPTQPSSPSPKPPTPSPPLPTPPSSPSPTPPTPSTPSPSTPSYSPPPPVTPSPSPSTPEPTPPTPTPSPSTPSYSPPPPVTPSPTPSTPEPTPPTPTPSAPWTPPSSPSPVPWPTPSTPPSSPWPTPSTPSTPSPSTPSTPSSPPTGWTPSPTPVTPPSATPTTPPSSGVASRKRVRCTKKGYGACYGQEFTCPASCPTSCQVDCNSCKPVCSCDYPGAVCQDPRFIGGDGITFYFHGKKDKDFCLVTDPNLHINAHFIGKTNTKMTRDFTWVQSIGILFNDHRLYVGARKTSTWDDANDRLAISLDGMPIFLPETTDSQWKSTTTPQVTVTRTSETNNIVVEIQGKLTITTKVVPITEEESRVHNYDISRDDSFAHLDLGFKFHTLSASVDGVLGKTYREDYVSKVKMGVAMPLMGGVREYSSSSLFATDCLVSMFGAKEENSVGSLEFASMNCASGMNGEGVVCKR